MTRTREENARDAMHDEELREAGQDVILRLPKLVPDDHMEFEDWLAWASEDLEANQKHYDDDYLPYMHEAAETAIFRRNAFDPWPAFTRALRTMIPEMAADAVVYEVEGDDGGRNINCPNTILTAARLLNGQIEGEVWSKSVSKEWLRDFCLADEIALAKMGIPEDHLVAASAAGWRVGHDPKDAVPGVVLVHDDLERVWPVDDVPGAMADIGSAIENDTDSPEP